MAGTATGTVRGCTQGRVPWVRYQGWYGTLPTPCTILAGEEYLPCTLPTPFRRLKPPSLPVGRPLAEARDLKAPPMRSGPWPGPPLCNRLAPQAGPPSRPPFGSDPLASKLARPSGLSPQQSQKALRAFCSTERGFTPLGLSPNRQEPASWFLPPLVVGAPSKLGASKRERNSAMRCPWAGIRWPVGQRSQQARHLYM